MSLLKPVGLLLRVLAMRSDATLTHLASRLGVSDRHVRRLLAQLERAGYISIGGRLNRRAYTVHTAAPLAPGRYRPTVGDFLALWPDDPRVHDVMEEMRELARMSYATPPAVVQIQGVAADLAARGLIKHRGRLNLGEPFVLAPDVRPGNRVRGTSRCMHCDAVPGGLRGLRGSRLARLGGQGSQRRMLSSSPSRPSSTSRRIAAAVNGLVMLAMR